MKYASLRLVFSAALVGVLCFGAPADAALMLTITDASNPGMPLIAIDNGANDIDPTVGLIDVGPKTIGAFTYSSLQGRSYPVVGNAVAKRTRISADDIGSVMGGTLSIVLTDSLELPAGPQVLYQFIGGTGAAGMLDFETSISGGPTVSNLGLSADPIFSVSDSAPYVHAGGFFDITSTVTVTMPGNELLLDGFTARTLVTVPEPATLSYLGLGLGALAVRRRRRRLI